MKNILIAISIALTAFGVKSSIYDINIKLVNGNVQSMSAYANKKLAIIPFSAVRPDTIQLRFLDSLQNMDSDLQVIAVPASDLGGKAENTVMQKLANSFSPKFVMLKQTTVKIEAGKSQEPLFRWLTSVNENTHFDADVNAAGQLFIVSRKGTLYSVVSADVPKKILIDNLNQTVNE